MTTEFVVYVASVALAFTLGRGMSAEREHAALIRSKGSELFSGESLVSIEPAVADVQRDYASTSIEAVSDGSLSGVPYSS